MSQGWNSALFRRRYVAAGGNAHAARSYVSYLNRAERVLNSLADGMTRDEGETLIGRAQRLPASVWGGAREKRDSLSALRRFVHLAAAPEPLARENLTQPLESSHVAAELLTLLAQAQELGAAYYALTGKPLGVTGEVAELEAARKVGVQLCAERTPGYDGWLDRNGTTLRVQVKGRAVSRTGRYRGRCPSFRIAGGFDIALLVLMDRVSLEAMEIWEADAAAVANRLAAPGSKARNERGSLAISQFKSIATRIWVDRED